LRSAPIRPERSFSVNAQAQAFVMTPSGLKGPDKITGAVLPKASRRLVRGGQCRRDLFIVKARGVELLDHAGAAT
jgi:hypothetical protein